MRPRGASVPACEHAVQNDVSGEGASTVPEIWGSLLALRQEVNAGGRTRYHVSRPRMGAGRAVGFASDFLPEGYTLLNKLCWDSRLRRCNERTRKNSGRSLGYAPRLSWVQYRKNISPEQPESSFLCQQAGLKSKRSSLCWGLNPGPAEQTLQRVTN